MRRSLARLDSASPTLRTVAGLPATGASFASPSTTALVMVDIQNTYRDGVMKLHNVDAAVANAAQLLREARAAGVPVFHVRHDAGEGSPYDVRAPIGQICDEVAPAEGEAVITKQVPNSFVGTDLEERLRSAGITDVVLAGAMTHMCISSTARGAFNLGFAPTVVANATATRALEAPAGGGVVSADAQQQASLAAMADLFAVVVPGVADVAGKQ